MTTQSPEIRYVDVFTRRPLLGNPVAVVLGADGLSDDTMQAVARWTNLSETTFVLESDVADYRVRIFSTVGEFPFAGHPTIGTAHAVREAGLVAPGEGPAEAVMECAAGPVPIVWNADGTITATVPVSGVVGPGSDVGDLGRLLGGEVLEPVLVIDTGPHWMVARMGSAGEVMAATPDTDLLTSGCEAVGASGLTIYGFDPEGGGAVEVRSFAPGDGVPEDPVCGSGNAAVARHLEVSGGLSVTGRRYTARQGRAVGRDGRVRVEVSVDGREISIGGPAVTVVTGVIDLRSVEVGSGVGD